MFNDTKRIDLMDLFSHFSKDYIKQTMKEHLLFLEGKSERKNTQHLEKIIEEHKKAIDILKAALDDDSTKFFYQMKSFICYEKKYDWTMTSFHMKKIVENIEQDNFEYAKRILYACGYQQYLIAVVLNNKKENTFKEHIQTLITIHIEMIEDIEKLIKNLRIRALFN